MGVDLIVAALTGGASVEIRTTGNPSEGGGDIDLNAALNYTNTGNNSLTLSAVGEIEINAAIFDSDFDGNDSLNLTLSANNDITISNSDIDSGGGNVFIESAQGAVNTSDILTIAGEDGIGSGGSVSIQAEGLITTGDIITASFSADGGNVSLLSSKRLNYNRFY